MPVLPDGKPVPNAPKKVYPTDPMDPTKGAPNIPVLIIPGYRPIVSTVTPNESGKDTEVVYIQHQIPVTPSRLNNGIKQATRTKKSNIMKGDRLPQTDETTDTVAMNFGLMILLSVLRVLGIKKKRRN